MDISMGLEVDLPMEGWQSEALFQPDSNTWRSLTAVSRTPSTAGLEFNLPCIRLAIGPSFVSQYISRPCCLALRWADVDKEKEEVHANNDSVTACQQFE